MWLMLMAACATTPTTKPTPAVPTVERGAELGPRPDTLGPFDVTVDAKAGTVAILQTTAPVVPPGGQAPERCPRRLDLGQPIVGASWSRDTLAARRAEPSFPGWDLQSERDVLDVLLEDGRVASVVFRSDFGPTDILAVCRSPWRRLEVEVYGPDCAPVALCDDGSEDG